MEVTQAQLAISAQVSSQHVVGMAGMIQSCLCSVCVLLEQHNTAFQVTWSCSYLSVLH